MPFDDQPIKGPSRPESHMHRVRPPQATYMVLDGSSPTLASQGLQAVVDAQVSPNASPYQRWYELYAVGAVAQARLGDSTVTVTLDTDGLPVTVDQPIRFWLGTPSEEGLLSAAGKALEPFIAAHGPGVTFAAGVLTLTADVANLDQVQIGGKTYTFQTVLTDVDGNVLIGGTASDSIDNLIAAITLGAGAGVDYATATTLHPTVAAAAGAGDTMDATAKLGGVAGNSISTTDPVDGGGVMSWAAVTLLGGGGDATLAIRALT